MTRQFKKINGLKAHPVRPVSENWAETGEKKQFFKNVFLNYSKTQCFQNRLQIYNLLNDLFAYCKCLSNNAVVINEQYIVLSNNAEVINEQYTVSCDLPQ